LWLIVRVPEKYQKDKPTGLWVKAGTMNTIKSAWGWVVLAAILGFYTWFQISLWDYPKQEIDMYYLYLDGNRVLNGVNPYSRVLQGDMYENDKYTTFFPAFIELSYLSQKLRYHYYECWLLFWQRFLLMVNLCITGSIFYIFNKLKIPGLGLFLALFWALNRWTLYSVQVRDIGFIPIFFLLVSFYLLPRHRWLALLSYSVSLAFKQIAIFLIPLYLILIYQETTQKKFIQTALAGITMLSIPFILSLPFMIWDLKGFALSILFSVTRSQWQFPPTAYSVDMLLDLNGFPARIPMLLIMLIVMLCFWKRQIKMGLASLLVMGAFVGLNSIIFNQYLPWFLIFLPLTILEMLQESPPRILSHSA
jgi:hypothetical protein